MKTIVKAKTKSKLKKYWGIFIYLFFLLIMILFSISYFNGNIYKNENLEKVLIGISIIYMLLKTGGIM